MAKETKVALSATTARELYELARAPRNIVFVLSKNTRAELLTALKPAEKKRA